MSILRAIWNGPFYAGPLVRPVSVGDAILKLLETIWRASVAIIALAAGLGAVALGWVYAIEPVFFPSASSKVKISAEFDDGSKFIVSTVPPPSPKGVEPMKSREPFRCNAEYPLKVTIRNLASKSITNVSFGLKAEIPHSSQDQLNAGEFSFPGIIEKGHEWTTCYRGKLENGVDPEEVIFIPRVYSAEYR